MFIIKKMIKKVPFLENAFKEIRIEYTIRKRSFYSRDKIKAYAKVGKESLKKVKDSEKYVFFCGIPTHNNMGDQAQKFCIEKWISENYADYKVIMLTTWPFFDKDFRKMLEEKRSKDSVFVIQSGYCTTSTHIDHYMHKYIVKTFDNPIIIMPQTILYNRKSDIRRTNSIYSKNKKLVFLARDRKSYHDAKRYFPKTKVLLCPDIVTTLIGDDRFQHNEDRNGVLLCVRNDSEKKYSDNAIEKLKAKFEKMGVKCEISDTNALLSPDGEVHTFSEELENMILFFGKHRVIITDRYHGTIFSMISNTPVIVLSTLDHKVKTGTQWFENIYDGSYFNADSIEEAYKMAKDILSKEYKIKNKSYFKEEYYDKLKSRIECLLP